MSYLGIDIGSSSIKGGVLDDGVLQFVRSRPFPEPAPDLPVGWFEIDADEVVTRCRELIGELSALAGPLDGILFCGQMGGVLLADSDLRATTRYLSWRDQRTVTPNAPGQSSDFHELAASLTPDEYQALGNELRPGSMLALLAWLKKHRQLPAGRTWALGIGDYVVARLCETFPKVHPTYALGMLDLASLDWHQALFERLGLGDIQWPWLDAQLLPLGKLRWAGQDIPCYPCLGDQQTALFGAGLQCGELSINVSTGSQVSLLHLTHRTGDFQMRPYLGGQWLATITHLPAGRSLNALVELLTEVPRADQSWQADVWKYIGEAVAATPQTDLQMDLSFFAGTMGERGSLQHMRLENLTVGHLFRAAFEDMAGNYATCAARLQPDPQWERLVLSGGLTQKLPALRDIIAARFGGDYRVVNAEEDTLQGLALMSRDGLKP